MMVKLFGYMPGGSSEYLTTTQSNEQQSFTIKFHLKVCASRPSSNEKSITPCFRGHQCQHVGILVVHSISIFIIYNLIIAHDGNEPPWLETLIQKHTGPLELPHHTFIFL
mmetsp:Transcript_31203/g.50968  ORF Transcript_31203/g.50968 Transcript_31203/m.50968 type:complete len:110 (-) Transcript_31203:530-859(-)